MPTPNEAQFEDFICAYLAEHAGYDAVKNDKEQAPPRDFDAVRGLDTMELFHFIGSTQIEDWNDPLSRYGNDPNVAQAKFADRLASELDRRGVVDVLRSGRQRHARDHRHRGTPALRRWQMELRWA